MDIRMLDIDQCPDKYHIPNSFKDTHKCDDKSSYVSKKFRLLKVDLQEKLDTSLKAVFWLSRECSSLNRRSRLSPSPVTCFLAGAWDREESKSIRLGWSKGPEGIQPSKRWPQADLYGGQPQGDSPGRGMWQRNTPGTITNSVCFSQFVFCKSLFSLVPPQKPL